MLIFDLIYFVKCWQMFLELNSKGLYQSLETLDKTHEFRHFHVLVVQRRQRNVQKKRAARAKLLFC